MTEIQCSNEVIVKRSCLHIRRSQNVIKPEMLRNLQGKIFYNTTNLSHIFDLLWIFVVIDPTTYILANLIEKNQALIICG